MRHLYTTLLRLLTPVVLVRLAWRGVRNRGYWSRWPERFGRFPAPSLRAPIWLHAVSVGETIAAAPIVRALRARYPERDVVVTTTTPTGSERVRALFGDDVFHVYLPYDLPGAVKRFLDRVRPTLAVIMETEIWPNLFAACHRREVPLIVANARLSARSASGYGRIGPLVREALSAVDVIAAQGEADAGRFRELGAPAERVTVAGNIKFDLDLPSGLAEQAAALREAWGADRPVLVAGSTHAGEDEQVLDAFERVGGVARDALLVMVPRHPERFGRLAELCRGRGHSVVRRSEGTPPRPTTDVYLADTMGELALMYAAADIAFLGGSLVPTGGHNMLEAAVQGVPVVTGPHLHNFREIAGELEAAGGMVVVDDADGLADTAIALFNDDARRRTMGAKGRAMVEANRGTLERLLAIIDARLDGGGTQ
ncbi:MAG: lipid IV(A) 3-deoxy-D-manno-octulosonic acid transferase [Pseudomonadota bacterium]